VKRSSGGAGLGELGHVGLRYLVEAKPLAGRRDLLDVLLDDAPELRLLGECAFTRVATACAFAVQRADLDANTACCKPRQPVALKNAHLSATQDELERRLVAPADEQLEQHVGVRVDDHRDERWSSEPKT
jgi:hypothetical protein